MNDQMKQELIEWGVDWEDASGRFMGKDELFAKFLLKFLNDKSYEQLQLALSKENPEEAFKACHTLKGVTSNLSLNGFKDQVFELTEILRAGKLDGADELFAQIKDKYVQIIEILKKYEE
ncbi:MAG: Hpt domain-containing protein [Butyrivibrio sp.]|nr:Hpt domain-containing protein [Butyrivibrio sp.]